MYEGHMWGCGAGFGGGLLLVLFWVIIIFAIVAVVRRMWGGKCFHPMGQMPGESALDILKKRYAKGEVTQEEYERMKKELTE
ncbi:SHOCT domain-containing protein [bacterium]|nr:MAG: SHOCT domain-containing protein [bacterium]